MKKDEKEKSGAGFHLSSQWHQLIFKYILHPFRMLMTNAGVFVIFFVVILFNFVTENNRNTWDASSFLSPNWVFVTLPLLLFSMIHQPIPILLLAATYAAKTVLTVVVAKEMMLIYTHHRKGIIHSIREIAANELLWFFILESLIYFIFSAIAIIIYVPLLLIWLKFEIDLTLILALVFVILYPAFYILLSTTSMLAVLPLTFMQRFAKLRYVVRQSAMIKLYLFYAVRLSLEALLLFIVPFIALIVWESPALATISAAIGLVLPFALLRGSAYELKLQILSEDADIKRIFASYFRE